MGVPVVQTYDSELTDGVIFGRILLVRGFGGGNSADLSRILRQAANLRRDAGQPILLWALVAAEADLPSAETQASMQRTFRSLLNYAEAVTLIVPGNGVTQSLLRSTLRGMTTLGGRNSNVRVVTDLLGASRAAGDSNLDVNELARAARAAGFDIPIQHG